MGFERLKERHRAERHAWPENLGLRVHGGATWGSSINREQLRDCTNFMAKLVPLVIEVVMDHPDTLWGQGTYPVVK